MQTPQSIDNSTTHLTNETFSDLKIALYKSLVGDMGLDVNTESYSGHHISITVRDGHVVFAASHDHRKKFGQLALRLDEFIKLVDIEALREVLQDVEESIKSLGKTIQFEIFQNGKRFLNIECILPSMKFIPDNKTIVLFHNVVEVSIEGNSVDSNLELSEEPSDHMLILDADGDTPRHIIFNDSDSVSYIMLYKTLINDLDRLRDSVSLNDDSTFYQYRERWWSREVDKLSSKFNSTDRDAVQTALVNNIPLDNVSPATKKWFLEFQESDLPRSISVLNTPFNRIFLQSDLSSMRRLLGILISNDPLNISPLRKGLQSALDAINKSDTKLDTLRSEFEKLKQIGMNKMVPQNGLICIINGRPRLISGSNPVNTTTTGVDSSRSSGISDDDIEKSSSVDTSAQMKKILQMKIRNPDTNNLIKVDTAMDYKKDHPAHRIALDTIRKYMGSISNRAGVEKNTKSTN